MWIYTNKGMLSVVENKHDARFLLVRARDRKVMEYFIERSNYNKKHFVDKGADYPFRINVPKSTFKLFMSNMIDDDLHYHNFKDSIEDKDYHDDCLECWSTMAVRQYQNYPEFEPDWVKTYYAKKAKRENKKQRQRKARKANKRITTDSIVKNLK